MLRLGWARGPSDIQIWEVAAWEIAQMGSCHLRKFPWEVATWEKAFVKVPNIGFNVYNVLVVGIYINKC